MIITTTQGAKFDTSKPARSSVVKVLDNRGHCVMDTLRITGNMTLIEHPEQDFHMIEVDGSFGLTEVSEEFIWQ